MQHDTIVPITSVSDSAYADFLRIYLESLPIHEQKSVSAIETMLSRKDYCIFLLKHEGNTIGFTIFFISKILKFVLLEYMAVDTSYRNQSFGSQLLRRSMEKVAKIYGLMPVVVEVDSDRELASDSDIRHRRQNFYNRLGFRRVKNLDYILPLLDEAVPPLMDIMIHLPTTDYSIGKEQIYTWLQEIYTCVYNRLSNDPRIEKMLKPLQSSLELV